MSRSLRIVFYGTDDFGIPCLEALSGSSDTLAGVVTTPDRPQGRELRMISSTVKRWAASHSVPCFEISKENRAEAPEGCRIQLHFVRTVDEARAIVVPDPCEAPRASPAAGGPP